MQNIEKSPIYKFGVVLPNKTGVYNDWVKRGWKVYVIANRHANYPPCKTIKSVLLFPIAFLYHKYINYNAYRLIKKIVIQEKYDIIHSNVGVLDIGYKAAISLSIPHIYHLREYQDLDFGEKIYPSKKTFIQRLKNKNNYTITITKNLYNYFNCNSSSVVIYNGVVTENLKSIDWNKEPYFLFAGRLSKAKGIESVLYAFEKLHKRFPQFRLKVAGAPIDSSYMDELKSMTSKLNISEHVHFLGATDKVSELMRKAMGMIMASTNEGLGRVTIEAMSEGCLVIGYNAHGTKEQFDNGYSLTGKEIGIRYLSSSELIEAMTEIASNGIFKYREMIESAQKTVSHLYSINKCTDSIINFYNHIFNEES